MPGLIVNSAEAMEMRKPLPPGEYHVLLTNHKLSPPGPSGYPGVTLEFTVHDDEGEEFAGKKAFRNLSASPNAAAFMVDAAMALGADESECVGTAVNFDAVFTSVRSNECWIQTSIREYQRNETSPVQEQTNVDNILAQPSN